MQITLFFVCGTFTKNKEKDSKPCMTLTAIMHFEIDIREPQTYFT